MPDGYNEIGFLLAVNLEDEEWEERWQEAKELGMFTDREMER